MRTAFVKSGALTAAILTMTGLAWAQAGAPPSGAGGPGPISVADLQKRALDRFNALDANKDGQLTQEELSAGRPAGGGGGATPAPAGGPPQGGGVMRGMMQSADANHDGTITSAEFTAAITARLQQMDANHDGQITGDELQAARAAQPAQ
jgi:hypothetical protein